MFVDHANTTGKNFFSSNTFKTKLCTIILVKLFYYKLYYKYVVQVWILNSPFPEPYCTDNIFNLISVFLSFYCLRILNAINYKWSNRHRGEFYCWIQLAFCAVVITKILRTFSILTNNIRIYGVNELVQFPVNCWCCPESSYQRIDDLSCISDLNKSAIDSSLDNLILNKLKGSACQVPYYLSNGLDINSKYALLGIQKRFLQINIPCLIYLILCKLPKFPLALITCNIRQISQAS